MSHGVSTAQSMAFPTNNSRSFTNLGSAAHADSKNSTANTLTSTMGGHGHNAWGSSNIWGSGSLTNAFTSRATTREHSRSRDLSSHPPASQREEIEGKTGSGSLVGTSVLDDQSYRPSYAPKRTAPTDRSISHARYTEPSVSQPRSFSIAGVSHATSNGQNLSTNCSRPPTISLNSSSAVPSNHSFTSGFARALPGRGADQPPNVYTKFDRPMDPMQKKPDSAIGSCADAVNFPSPTDDRRPQNHTQHRTVSVPASREASMPSSSHSDEWPTFSRPDYSRTTQITTPSSSRAPSIASQRNGSMTSTANWNSETTSTPLAQLRCGGDNRTTTSTYRPSPTANGFSVNGSVMNGAPTYVRNGYANATNGADRNDEMDDINRLAMTMNQLELDGYLSPQQSAVYPEYDAAAYSRFLQASTNNDTRNGQTYTNGHLMSRGFEMPPGSRSPMDWQGFANGGATMPVSRRSPTLPDAAYYLDPRVQQLMTAQLRNPYASAMYNAYNMQNGMQLGAPSPYMSLVPVGLSNIEQGPTEQELAAESIGVQSALMYEFKSNTKTKRYELKDIYDHIAEFSGDQHGSRFIQTKLETANSDEKERVFAEIQPNAIPLMTDVFGNYVIQKFFEHGDQTHKKILANKMRGRVLELSLQMYGCRVVQKALDHVLIDQQEMLITELKHNVLKCVKDQNGNHVIQKAIERCPAHTIAFITDAFRGQVQHLAIHSYGCRVIQRCLERIDTPAKPMIMAELLEGIQSMISDQYGNYVVQHIVSKDEGQGRYRVLEIVARGLEGYSKHKYASNVVEKCLVHADDHWRRRVIFSLAEGSQRRVDGEGVLVGMIRDNFGNYVIQKLLDTLNTDDYLTFLDALHPAMNQAKRTGCGKQLLAIEKRMQRFPPFRATTNNNSLVKGPPPSVPTASAYNLAYQHSLPTPPFASHYASNANTPPPLTADTRSLQSSGLPSVNGDAVEGAAVGGFGGSRKGSDGL